MARWMRDKARRAAPLLAGAAAIAVSAALTPVGQTLWVEVLRVSGSAQIAHLEREHPHQGCPPDYWSQERHYPDWPAGLSPEALFGGVFFAPDVEGEIRLADALRLGGDEIGRLMRQATAALLNAAHDGVEYAYRTDDVLRLVEEGIRNGELQAVISLLQEANEAGCPLSDPATETATPSASPTASATPEPLEALGPTVSATPTATEDATPTATPTATLPESGGSGIGASATPSATDPATAPLTAEARPQQTLETPPG